MSEPTVTRDPIGVDQPIPPNEPLPEPPDISRGSVVVIEGRAPIWRCAMAFHRLHSLPPPPSLPSPPASALSSSPDITRVPRGRDPWRHAQPYCVPLIGGLH